MLGKTLATAVVAAFIAVIPVAAYAAPANSTITADEDYTPRQHTVPSLDGSAVSSECIGDVPYINYSVAMTDPDNIATGHDVSLIMSDGTNTTTIALGTLDANNQLSGTILWPGASVDSQGNATGWPGYAFVNGEYVPTDGNFAWTRGPITAMLQVNPELTVALSYPPASALCASPPAPNDPSSTPNPTTAALAATGSDFDPAPLLLAGGALVVVGGLAVFLVGRRAARRH